MNHDDHVNLIKGGVERSDNALWADLGSGAGAFTLALADVLGVDTTIYSVDKNAGSLREQERAMRTCFPETHVQYQNTDFTKPLTLPPLDGILMANSLHYVPRDQQTAAIRRVKGYLRPGGRLLIVEYNVDQGNFAVPYPISFSTWRDLAVRSGFTQTRLLATRPSRFLHEFYAAVSF